MNQRIKELEKQSYIELKDENSFDCLVFSKEKFAELIVEEVYDFIMDKVGNDNGIPDLGKVKEHFGV